MADSPPDGRHPAAGFTLPFTPERPLFYLHVPKCGGTSVNSVLRRGFPPGAVRWFEYHPAKLAGNEAGLGRHACYGGHVVYRFRDRLPPAAAVATFLRDPVDRAVSAFYFFRSLGKDALAREGVTPGLERCCDLPLGEFLRAEPTAARLHLGNVQTWMFSQPHMYMVPPARELTPADLAAAEGNLAACAFVGLTERIGESMRMLCRMCDWPAPDEVPHANRTPVRPAVAGLDAETRGRLEELTAYDAALYRLGCEMFAGLARDTPRLPPAPGRVELTFDGPVPGEGWYDPEPSPGGYFSWTRAAAWVEARLAGAGDLEVAIGVVGAVRPDQLDGLAAAVNGRPVPLTRTRVGAVDRFAGRVPAAPAGDRYRVALRVPHTIRPCDVVPGSTDPRDLGVAVARMELGFADAA